MQDPDTHGLYAQWTVKPGQGYVFNYKQIKLQEENPDHPFANIRWFNITELSYQKNCLVKGNKAAAADAKRVTRITLDIDKLISLHDIENSEKLTNALRFGIVKTRGNINRGRFQLAFHIAPVHSRHYRLVEQVHKALFDLYNNLFGGGVDRSLIGDRARFDRFNLKQENVINPKTGDSVEVLREGYIYTLPELKDWLKGLGYQFFKHQKFSKSLRLIRRFFNRNEIYEGNQRTLAQEIGVPYRSLKYLIKKMEAWKELEIKWRGNNTPGNLRRSWIASNIFRLKKFQIGEGQQNIFKSFHTPGLPCLSNKEDKKNNILTDFYSTKVIPTGSRNKVAFALALEIKNSYKRRITENELFALLEKSFDFEGLQDDFKKSELRKIVKSALNLRYKFPISAHKLRERGGKWGGLLC